MKKEETIPEEDIEYVKVSSNLKQWVEDVTRSGDAPRYNFSGWPSDLWNKSATEILDYLEDRFNKTTDDQEYYRCMLYLPKRIDAKTLFVPWHESPNFKRIRAQEMSENCQEGTNTLAHKTPVLRSRRESYRGLVSRVKYGGRHGRV